MDNKTWKKSTEKTILTDDRANLSMNSIEEEKPSNDKAQHEKDLKILNEKLSAALSECNAREDIAKKQANLAQEAITGWERAETEVKALKLELEKSSQQRVASEEKLNLLDGALKECMQQLRFVRAEQEKRICDAVKKASKEFERTKTELDERLSDAAKRLAKLEALKAQTEADHEALMARINSTEKENTSLKYEVRVLEKELEIRNEEREFNRRTADVSHKQHLENLKKIAKLESECHRLRLLVRKRLPGPAALTKMKSEVKMLGKDQHEKRSSSSLVCSMDLALDIGPDTLAKRVNFPIEQSLDMEEQNRALKETLNKTIDELQTSRLLHCHSASPLSQDGSLGDDMVAEFVNTLHPTKEHSLASMSDMGSEDKISCAESWASALISEVEQFKNGKEVSKPSSIIVGFSDMSLMDDFVQMEKLATASAQNSSESNNHAVQTNSAPDHSIMDSTTKGRDAVASEVLALHDLSIMSSANDGNHSEKGLGCATPTFLAEMPQTILEKNQELQRNATEMLEEVKAALPQVDCLSLDKGETSKPDDVSSTPNVTLEGSLSPVNSLRSGSSLMGTSNDNIQAKKSNQKPNSRLSVSMHKIIELIEGICMQLPQDCNSEMLSTNNDRCLNYMNSETLTGFMVRVFQWKSSDLSATLEQFVQACNDLLNEKSDVENFAERLTFTLAWVMDHCFSLQDVSSMKDAIKNRFDWDEAISESEVDIGTINQPSESNKIHVREKEPSSSTLDSVQYYQNSLFQVEEVQRNGDVEATRFRDESPELPDNESANRDLEGTFQSQIHTSESLMNQRQESSKSIESRQREGDTSKQLKEDTIYKSEADNVVRDDLETELTEAKFDLSRASKIQTFIDTELDNRSNAWEKSGVTFHDLQFQQESMDKVEVEDGMEHVGTQLRTDLEITAASEKLAECQETILNLGKQLKALTPPKEGALSPTVITGPADTIITNMTAPSKKVHNRSSLLDKMLAEDNADIEVLRHPKTKEFILNDHRNSAFSTDMTSETLKRFTNTVRVDNMNSRAVVSSSAVPSKKRSGGLLRKLFSC